MDSIGYLNGRWVETERMSLGIDDLGFLQGVTAVERLRTWNGRLPLADGHLHRFQRTGESLRIEGLPPVEQLRELLTELLRRNSPESDTGIVVFATPGRRGAPTAGTPRGATLGLHLSPLDFPRLERLRREGQSLVVSDVRQPPLDCWPREIKVRCRIHYYLADHQARQRDPEALAVLLDDDGSITETSVANVSIVDGGRLRIPPRQRILPGVMLQAFEKLAEQAEIPVERGRISPQMLRDADEVLLTGTEAGLWPACRVDDVEKVPGPICRRLQPLLRASLGIDR